MTKTLVNKIIQAGIYDTKQYRYICQDNNGLPQIKRIDIKALDTTAALSDQSHANPNGWEVVYNG